MKKLFKVWEQDGQINKEAKTIYSNNIEAVRYNRFLKTNYLTIINENEDFIPMQTGKQAIMVLSDKMFDFEDELLEPEAFDLLESILYTDDEVLEDMYINYYANQSV